MDLMVCNINCILLDINQYYSMKIKWMIILSLMMSEITVPSCMILSELDPFPLSTWPMVNEGHRGSREMI